MLTLQRAKTICKKKSCVVANHAVLEECPLTHLLQIPFFMLLSRHVYCSLGKQKEINSVENVAYYLRYDNL